MTWIVRVPESELQSIEEDRIFCEYKKLVWPSNDLDILLELLPPNIIDSQGTWIQILDLWGWDGLFCNAIYEKLPNATIILIDKSDEMINLAHIQTRWFKVVHDDMRNFTTYLDERLKTLVVCRGTIHHLDDPAGMLTTLLSYQDYWLLIKDLIRPSSEIELEDIVSKVMQLAIWIEKKWPEFSKVIENLTRQSLYASLSEEEVHNTVKDYINENTMLRFNTSHTYYELIRKTLR